MVSLFDKYNDILETLEVAGEVVTAGVSAVAEGTGRVLGGSAQYLGRAVSPVINTVGSGVIVGAGGSAALGLAGLGGLFALGEGAAAFLMGEDPDAEIGRAHVELQSHSDLVCRLLLEKKKTNK